MKLSEVTLRKTHLVFEDDSDTRIPDIGTEVELDGKTYKWRGQMWTEVKPDGTNGRAAGDGARLTSQWRTSNPVPRSIFKLTPGVQQLSDNKFMITLPDQTTVVETASRADADAVQARVDELVDELGDQKPRDITTAVKADIDGGKLTTTKFTRSWSLGRAIRNGTAADYENMTKARNSGLGKLLQNRTFKIVMGFVAAAGLIYGMVIEIEQVQIEIEAAEREGGDVERLKEIKSILVGQLIALYAAQVAVLLTRTRYVKALLAPIRMAVRGGQLATALTGVGAIPSLISLIVTEAFWIVIPLILNSTSMQRWLAEVIVDSSFGDLVATVGRNVTNVATFANTYLEGRFGTGTLARALNGYDPKEVEGVTGEYYGESEWAKLVFGTLMFPPGGESILIPYIPKDRRETLLTGTLGLNPMDAAEVAGDQEGDQNATDGGMAAIDRRMDSDAAVTRRQEAPPAAVDANSAEPRGNPSGASSWEDMTPEDFEAMAANGNFGG